MDKARAVLDFDGVITQTYTAFDTWVKENYDIDFSDPAVDLGAITNDIFRFFDSPALQDFPIIPGAKEGLVKLAAHGWEINFCSIRNKKIRLFTLRYLAKHGIIFDSWAFATAAKTKLDHTAAVGGCLLVEDEIRHLLPPQHPHIHRILFHSDAHFTRRKNEISLSQASTQDHFPPEKIHRVQDWGELVALMEKLKNENEWGAVSAIDPTKFHV